MKKTRSPKGLFSFCFAKFATSLMKKGVDNMFGLTRKEKVYATVEKELQQNWRMIQYFTQRLEEEELTEELREIYNKKVKYYRIRRDEDMRLLIHLRHM